jgi:L-ascorbate metabolism protein UlaG (beta-lactamase superfamily)
MKSSMLALSCLIAAGAAAQANPVLTGLSWLATSNQFGSPSLLLERDKAVVYVDPVKLSSLDTLPEADYILITHAHPDHYDLATIRALLKKGAVIVAPADVAFKLGQAKVKGVKSLVPGDTLKTKKFVLEAVPMFTAGDSSAHPKVMDWIGYALTYGKTRYYFSGDSGLTAEMNSMTGFDVAVVNMRKAYLSGGEQVAAWAAIAKPKVLVPTHWIDGNAEDKKDIDALKAGIGTGVDLVFLKQR